VQLLEEHAQLVLLLTVRLVQLTLPNVLPVTLTISLLLQEHHAHLALWLVVSLVLQLESVPLATLIIKLQTLVDVLLAALEHTQLLAQAHAKVVMMLDAMLVPLLELVFVLHAPTVIIWRIVSVVTVNLASPQTVELPLLMTVPLVVILDVRFVLKKPLSTNVLPVRILSSETLVTAPAINVLMPIVKLAVEVVLTSVLLAMTDLSSLVANVFNAQQVLLAVLVLLQLTSEHASLVLLTITWRVPHVLNVRMVPIPLALLLPAQLVLILVVLTALDLDCSNVPLVPLITIRIALILIVLLVVMESTHQRVPQVHQMSLVPLVLWPIARPALVILALSALLDTGWTQQHPHSHVMLVMILPTVLPVLAAVLPNAQLARMLLLTPLSMVFVSPSLMPLFLPLKLEESWLSLVLLVTLLITLQLVELTTSLTQLPTFSVLVSPKLKFSVLFKVQSLLNSEFTPFPLLPELLLMTSSPPLIPDMLLVTSTSMVPKSTAMAAASSPSLDVLVLITSIPTAFAKLAPMIVIPVPLVMKSVEPMLVLSSVVSSVVSPLSSSLSSFTSRERLSRTWSHLKETTTRLPTPPLTSLKRLKWEKIPQYPNYEMNWKKRIKIRFY
jgi:hypothetical protein